ncbi:hypothetical protein NLN62_51650 (plasmid) [Bradyrhizobium sp. CCGUVB23]|nr:hypothetical protein [Bradyrhizobium sp. CCGUVB23]MCP3468527.1 hypothetical protein [Bradyrhizobium sp. CCGUVB23]
MRRVRANSSATLGSPDVQVEANRQGVDEEANQLFDLTATAMHALSTPITMSSCPDRRDSTAAHAAMAPS